MFLHVDINSYFATILQQENPLLRGKPVGVLKSEGRTCLIATSKEAKAFGVGTGTRKPEALLKCPQIHLIPASFDRYLDTTKRLQKIFQSISPDIFIYSLDEAFIDVSKCQQHLYADLQELAEQIQQQITTELGEWVTCNIGIAENRFLAKLASEVAETGGILQISNQNKDALLARVKFKDVCGVGYRLEKKLARLNVEHPYQIRFIPEEELLALVGPFWTKELQKISYGQETHLLKQLEKQQPHMKSVGRSITGYRLYSDQTEIRNILKNLSLEVIHKIRDMRLSGRNIRVTLYGQTRKWSAHETLLNPIDHTTDIIHWVETLYRRWPQDFRVIKFAVRLSLLQPQQQDELLPEWQRNESVQKALDAVNKKYGMFTLHPAAVPPKKDLIKPEVTGFLGDRMYQLKD